MEKNIADLISQVVTYKAESEVDLLLVEFALLPGRQSLRNAALQSYRDARNVLVGAIGSHAGGIFVQGPGSEKFAKAAGAEIPAITLNAAEMYEIIAKHWFPTVRVDKTFALDCLPAMMGGINTVLLSLGVRQIAHPEFGGFFGRPVNSVEDATVLTREILRGVVGDDLNGLYVNYLLTDEAIRLEWDLKFIPVVLLNATKEEIEGDLFKGLFYAHNIVVEAPETFQKSFVVQAAKRLAAKLHGGAENETVL